MKLLDWIVDLTYGLLALIVFLSITLVVWRIRADRYQARVQAERAQLQKIAREYLAGTIGLSQAKDSLRAHPEVLVGVLIGFAADASKVQLRKLERLFDATGLLALKLKQLKDREWIVRSKAANALGFMGSRSIVPDLLGALHDEVLDVRLSAAWSLAHLKAGEAVIPILENVLVPGTWPFQRVVEVLVQMGPIAIPPLMETLGDPSTTGLVRTVTIRALGSLKVIQAAELIEPLLRDPDLEVRIQSAKVLGDLGQKSSVQALVGALTDSSWQVRAAATQSLGRIRDDAAVPGVKRGLADPSWWVRFNSAEALYEMGERGRTQLERSAASHEDAFARDISKQILKEHEA